MSDFMTDHVETLLNQLRESKDALAAQTARAEAAELDLWQAKEARDSHQRIAIRMIQERDALARENERLLAALAAVRRMFDREYSTLMLEDGNGEVVTATFMPSHWRGDLASVTATEATIENAIIAAAAGAGQEGGAV